MPGPLRVLMTADTMGGVWQYCLDLSNALAQRGVRIALAVMGAPPNREQRHAAERIPYLELFESSFKLEWMEDPWDDVARAGDWLLGLERKLQPDLIHLNGYAHGAFAWNAPVVMAGHSCVLSWWRAVRGEDAPPKYDAYKEAVTRGLRSADIVIAPSRAMLQALEEHYGRLGNSRVIPNGRSHPPADGPKQDFVLSVGRLWDAAKNIELLDRAAAHLPWTVYVAGEAEHPEGGAARFPNLRQLGRLPDNELSDWYSRASIFALPARYEPFGLSPLEAASAGCALVLGDIPSLREIWGDAAQFVAADDAEALENLLRELIDEPPVRLQWAARAQARAAQFTTANMARSYIEAYQEVLAHRVLIKDL